MALTAVPTNSTNQKFRIFSLLYHIYVSGFSFNLGPPSFTQPVSALTNFCSHPHDMKSLILLATPFLAGLVSAQASVGSLPSCAIPCVTSGIAATGCALTDVIPPTAPYLLNRAYSLPRSTASVRQVNSS